MRGRQLIIYLALFVIVVSFYLVYEVAFRGKKAKFEESEVRLYTLSPSQVTAIALKNGQEEIHLVRQGDRGWMIDRSVQTPAMLDSVERLLDAAMNGKKERVLAGSSADLAEFGLSIPHLSLSLMSGPKILAPTLYVGAQDPVGTTYYARLGQTREVFTISAPLYQGLNQTLYNLRNKSLLLFDTDKIGSLKVERPLEQEVKKTAEGQWVMSGAETVRADGAKIDRILLEGLKGQVAAFSPAGQESATAGFDSPLLKLRVRAGAGFEAEVVVGAAKKKEVESGQKESSEPEGYWVRTTQRPEVMLIDPSTYEALRLAAADLRDKHLVRFDQQAVRAVELRRGTVVFKAAWENDSWKITEPAQPKTVPDQVAAFLQDLHGVEYVSRLEGDASSRAAKALAAGPGLTVKLSGEGGLEVVLTVGTQPTAEGLVPARIGSGPVVQMSAGFVEKLPPDMMAPVSSSKVGEERKGRPAGK